VLALGALLAIGTVIILVVLVVIILTQRD